MLISRSKIFLRTALLAVTVPALSLPATLALTGTQVAYNESTGPTNFNTMVTVNGDSYDISGNYGGSYNSSGTNILFNPNVVYTGSMPTAQTDVLTVTYTQTYFDNSPGNWDGTYSEHIPLNVFGVAAGSTSTGELFADNQGVGAITFVGDGNFDQTKSLYLPQGGNPDLTGSVLTEEFEFTYNFTAGTMPGAGAVSTPEPVQALPIGLGLAAFLFMRARRRRDGISKTA